ncbi:MAG: hypothetical protein KTR18_10420 [Acidiferrobacterales bacterium]|nr:hypothetical protein [Acidiferrobacterales bacterium]
MQEGELKTKLQACKNMEYKSSDWSIGHRGAPLQFPEHTFESNLAAATMGAGILECDVTFTRDRELVCRHSQNDLHTTTNILKTSLAEKCSKPFTPASANKDAAAECRTSDISLSEYQMLSGKMDSANTAATTVDEYVNATPNWRTDLYSATGKLMTHAEHIELGIKLGVKFAPELKSPVVKMPYQGDYSQERYAQQMIDDYVTLGVDPSRVYPQSFNLQDILYWLKYAPEYGAQAVYLDDSYRSWGWSPMDASTWRFTMEDLKAKGVNYIAPPIWVLVTLDDGKIVPSVYAVEAKKAGLKIITWTLERSGLIHTGGGWYYQSVADVIDNEGDVFELLNVLHEDVGVVGVFSDWPATTTFYANCFGL